MGNQVLEKSGDRRWKDKVRSLTRNSERKVLKGKPFVIVWEDICAPPYLFPSKSAYKVTLYEKKRAISSGGCTTIYIPQIDRRNFASFFSER